MIFTEKQITINNNQCKIDSPVVLYRGDYNVEVRFTIVSSPYKYSNKQETNVIEQTEASYGQLVIKTPGDKAPIFSEITTTKRGAITFTITAEMIDEISEVGDYTFQIRLLDENKQSRATIPEVKNGIEIREPIASEDVSTTNEVGIATVGYALTTAGTTEDAFDSQGNYNKTTWGTGDRITDAKLNKIEAGIDGVNKKVASVGESSHTHSNKDILDTITADNVHTHSNKSVIDAITSDMTTKWNKSIPFEDSYVSDCNAWLTNGYTKTNPDTANHPSVCTGTDKWGVLFYISENVTDGNGIQMYFPIDGTYAGRIFTRQIKDRNAGVWNLTSTFDGNYDSLTNKPTIGGDTPSVAHIEPEELDIPKVFFNGDKPTDKTSVNATIEYISKTEHFKAYVDIKCQGTSSMTYPKKNYTIKMFSDEAKTTKLKKDFKGWGKQSKFCLKANYIDHSHARNIVSAKLWGQVVKSRSDFDTLPEELKTSPNYGAVDGFPIKVYYNGTYEGVYTWNIPKDGWMNNMDDKLDTHCILCGEEYSSGCFREANASLWSDELHDVMPANIVTSFNAFQNFVINSSDDEFKTGLSTYADVNSLIDYYIFQYAICGLDSMGKNQLFFTYDGTKWIASSYDMDSTFGLYWNGQSFVSTTYRMQEDYESMANGRLGNLLYIRLEELFYEEIKARYAELRAGVLSYANIVNEFEKFMDVIGKDLYAEDLTLYTEIPSGDTNNIQQIRSYTRDRLAYVDSIVARLVEESISYELPEATVFNGTDTFIDTAIRLLSNDNIDKDWTMLIDFTSNSVENEKTIAHCMLESGSFPGLTLDFYDSNLRAVLPNNNGITLIAANTNRHKFIITKSGNTFTVYDESMSQLGTNTPDTVTTVGQTLLLGAYQDASGVKSRFFNGTIHKFKLVEGVMSREDCLNWMA